MTVEMKTQAPFWMDISHDGDWETVENVVAGCRHEDTRASVNSVEAAYRWMLQHFREYHAQNSTSYSRIEIQTRDVEIIGNAPMANNVLERMMRRIALVQLIEDASTGITASEIREASPEWFFAETPRSLGTDLGYLMEQGYVSKTGHGNGTRYFAVPENDIPEYAQIVADPKEPKPRPKQTTNPAILARHEKIMGFLSRFPTGKSFIDILNEFPDMTRSELQGDMTRFLIPANRVRADGAYKTKRYYATSDSA